MLSISPNYNIT